VGWLVVEDLVVVLVLVLLPALAPLLGGRAPEPGDAGLWSALVITLAKVAAFVAVMLIVAKRFLPRLLWGVARTGSRELFTLAVISSAVGVAYLSAELFSVSFALGAFFAGMMMRESSLRIAILLRTHSDEEAELLRQENLGQVFMGEHELALAMTREVLARMAARTTGAKEMATWKQ
jgi:predicted Kef-type K+ transport protein